MMMEGVAGVGWGRVWTEEGGGYGALRFRSERKVG